MLEAALANAAESIAAEKWSAALESLLVAWRARRIERLAALIDRVATRLPTTPIKAKTVKARTAAWLELAKRQNPDDVATLVATPWPGKWQDAMPVLDAYDAFPSDPRIALAIASFAVTAPFESRASTAFYENALRILGQCRDDRTKPVLQAEVARANSRWPAHARRICESTLSMMTDAPALDPAEESALASVEALFASDVRAEATNEKSEGDFLAAIYADPLDDALRAVYADWLTERGDPRGEFITLQLTSEPSPKAKKREAALLKKHGAAFAGALDRVFSKDARIWTRGFLTGGVIYDREELTKELAHPEWALIDTLYVASFRGEATEALLAAPWLENLRSLTGVPEAMVAKMAERGLGPKLEELHMRLADEDEVDPEARQRIARGFPRLKRLGITNTVTAVRSYLAGPMPAIERLVVSQGPMLAEVSRAVKPDVAIVEARGPLCQWHFELHRDAQRQFTRLRGTPVGNWFLSAPRQLRDVIEFLPKLEELRIEPGAEWKRDDIARLEATLAAKNLRVIDVPWDRGVGPRTVGAPRIKLHFRSRVSLDQDLDVVWDALTSPPLALEFDSMSVNFGAHEPLDGIARVRAAYAKKRTHSVAVYRKRTAETMVAIFRGEMLELTVPRDAQFDLEGWLAWLVTFLDRTRMSVVASPFLTRDSEGDVCEQYTRRVGAHFEVFRWLMGFADEKQYSFDDLAALANELPGVRVARAKRHLLLLFGDSPDEYLPDELVSAFDAKLKEAFWKQYERQRGFVPMQLTAEILGSALVARGFEPAPRSTWTRNGGAVSLEKRLAANDDIALGVQLRRADGNARLVAITDRPVSTKELARSALEAFLPKLDTLLPWLE